jgi:hypothetical protein
MDICIVTHILWPSCFCCNMTCLLLRLVQGSYECAALPFFYISNYLQLFTAASIAGFRV